MSALRIVSGRRIRPIVVPLVVLLFTFAQTSAATSGETPERVSIWYPGRHHRQDRRAASGGPASKKEEAEVKGHDDDDVTGPRVINLVPVPVQETFLSPDGRRWIGVPDHRNIVVPDGGAGKRKWEGRQMVVWGKRGLPRKEAEGEEGFRMGMDDKRGSGKHKWAKGGNMAVWG